MVSVRSTLKKKSPQTHLHVVGMLRFISDINRQRLPTPFLKFCSCVYFCLYCPFNCISIHKFSRQLSVFSHCSPSLISAYLVLSTIYLFLKVSLNGFRDPVHLPCSATYVGGGRGSWRFRYPLAVVCWVQHISLARTSLRRVVGLAQPNQLAGLVEP